MRYPKAALIIFTLIYPIQAMSSSCNESCYSAKLSCNETRGHTFNSCEKELFSCKNNCNSRENKSSYRTDSLPFELAPYLL